MSYDVSPGQVSSGISLTDDDMYVSSGGVATATVVNSGGSVCVAEGAMATRTTVNESGSMTVAGAANDTVVNGSGYRSPGIVSIVSGGTADHTAVNSGGSVCVENGGIASATTVNEYGSVHVFGGGLAVDTAVESGGSMSVNDGGTASTVLVNGGGFLEVREGGSAVAVRENGGCVKIDGSANVTFIANAFHGLLLSEGSATLHSGTSANETTVENFGALYIYESGSATATAVKSGGNLYVSSRGTASRTTVESDGNLYISSGGAADTVLLNGGWMCVDAGGSASEIAVNDGGSVSLFGTAAKITVSGADRWTCGELYVFSGGSASEIAVNNGGWLCVAEGGSAAALTVDGGGMLYVSSGGTATGIRENGGSVDVAEGADVTFAANEFSGLTLADGSATLHSGTIANSTTVRTGGELYVYDGGTARETVLTGTDRRHCAEFYVYEGGTATSTVVNVGGWMYVGGTADSTAVGSGGYLDIAGGGRHTGTLTIAEGAVVSAFSGSTLDFTLSSAAVPGGTALVNDLSRLQGTPDFTLTVSASQAAGVYKLAGGVRRFDEAITVKNDEGSVLGTLSVGDSLDVSERRYTLDLNSGALWITVGPTALPGGLAGTEETQSWDSTGAARYFVEYSVDGFAHVMRAATAVNAMDSFAMPAGTYSWRVRSEGNDQWVQGDDFVSDHTGIQPEVIRSDEDGIGDIFFAGAAGVWGIEYAAHHVGIAGGWQGTDENVSLSGKNRLNDFFEGSSDANLLLMTDSANGDALFVDDVYTALPGGVAQQQSRIAGIDEIRAGAGDDVVDLTSRRFAYIGGGLTVRGGDGDDTIWANAGDNMLFGDAGKDRLVGASGNDVLAGGAGDDTMHGGGGNDIFTFCENWGTDTVEQLAGGTVTLWFASGLSDNWDASTLTYSDGINSVTVSGITAENITLKFGGDGSEKFETLTTQGAFADRSSEKIFEDPTHGMIA